MQKSMQHLASPRGPPPQYYPDSNLLNSAVRMGRGDDMAAWDICGIVAILKCSNIMDRRFGSAELHPPSGVGWWEKTETRKRRGARGGAGGLGGGGALGLAAGPFVATRRNCHRWAGRAIGMDLKTNLLAVSNPSVAWEALT